MENVVILKWILIKIILRHSEIKSTWVFQDLRTIGYAVIEVY